MMPNPERTDNETEFDDTFEYLVATAQYTLADRPERKDDVEAFRTFMMYLVLRFKLFDSGPPQNSLAAGLGAESFLIYYRVRRNLRAAATFAVEPQNWRPPPSPFSTLMYELFGDLRMRVPEKFGALKKMHPFGFATLMLPKVLRDRELNGIPLGAKSCSSNRGSKGRVLH